MNARPSPFLLVLCCIGSALLALTIDRQLRDDDDVIGEQTTLAFDESIAPTSRFSEAARRVTPSVVTVRAHDQNGTRRSTVNGSGVIISADGYIATNKHVIEEATEIEIILADRRQFSAELIGVDGPTDLALLRVEGEELPYLRFGDSDSLQVGDWVMAVGNPFQLENTVTAGIVSAKGRSIDVLEGEDRIESFIQSDASVNPGNSGGALVNTRGQLVGINTAIMTESGRHEGFAFAIPGNLVRRVLNDLATYGEVRRATLGAYVQRLNARQADQLGLEEARGTIIAGIREGGAADRAGLLENDVLLTIDGTRINSPAELQEKLSLYRPNDQIEVEYLREQQARQLTVRLQGKSSVGRIATRSENTSLRRIGLELRELTAAERQELSVNGLRITHLLRDGAADRAGMEVDFVITHLNGDPVRSLASFTRALRNLPASGYHRLKGQFPGYRGEYFFELPVGQLDPVAN